MKKLPVILICIVSILSLCSFSNTDDVAFVGSGAVRPGLMYVDGTSWIPVEGQMMFTSQEYTYEVSARDGGLWIFYPDGRIPNSDRVYSTIVEGEGTVHWACFTPEMEYYTGLLAKIEVLIKKGDRYVGYAAVGLVDITDNLLVYVTNILECEVLPEEDTTTVLTAEYLRERVDNAFAKYGDYIVGKYKR